MSQLSQSKKGFDPRAEFAKRMAAEASPARRLFADASKVIAKRMGDQDSEGKSAGEGYALHFEEKLHDLVIESVNCNQVILYVAALPHYREKGGDAIQDASKYLIISVRLYKDGFTTKAEDDQPDPREKYDIGAAGEYSIVLYPEAPPVIVQNREWEGLKVTTSQKLMAFPNHVLDDDESEKLLELLATAEADQEER